MTAINLQKFSVAAREIVEAGKFLYAQGWSPATSSNYSARINDEALAITVSGRHKGRLSIEDVMAVDLQGRPLQSNARSSAETLLHTVIYELFPDVGAVLHTHSVGATVLSRVLEPGTSLSLEGYELQKAFCGVQTHESVLEIPVFDNTQDITALSQRSVSMLKDNPGIPGYLIRGHGLYTWAPTMADCLRHIEAFEFLFQCELETMRIKR